MGKYSYDLYNSLSRIINIELLNNKNNSKYIILFYLRVLFHLLRSGKDYSHIHLCDGVLAPIGYIIKTLTNKKVSITIHALDIVYNSRVYQWIIPKCLAIHDHVVCVSHFSINECVQRGIDRDRCVFIPNGIDFNITYEIITGVEDIENKYNIKIQDRKVLFSVCRLIKRKGIAWFISNVLPKLSDDFIYIVAGDGPEREHILNLIKKYGLENRVALLGRISEQEKICLFRYASYFIMPNIKVSGDAEGFGISLIESAAQGLPSIASNIEGIPDAVINGKTGILVQERDVKGFLEAIKSDIHNRELIKSLVKYHFNWSNLKLDYVELFNVTI